MSLPKVFIIRKHFPDPEPPIINNLCGWSGISGHFGLCYFMSSFVI